MTQTIDRPDGAPSLELSDLSPVAGARAGGTRPVRWGRQLLRGLVPLALIGLWQLADSSHWVSAAAIPAPGTIVAAFRQIIDNGQLWAALPVSIRRSMIGLAIGGSIGLVLGLFGGLWKIGEELVDALLQMLRTIPFIALVPLFIVWFGIDERPKIYLIAAATIFPMYLNTYAGVRNVDQKLIEVGRLFRLSRLRIITRIVLPMALPGILVGLRYATGVSFLALVAAEQINATSGIGFIVNNASQNQRPDILIAGIIVYAALGIVGDIVMRLVERLALPWRLKVSLG